jgi:hypothetical protein
MDIACFHSLSISVFFAGIQAEEKHPSRAEARVLFGLCGTAEAVPFQNRFNVTRSNPKSSQHKSNIPNRRSFDSVWRRKRAKFRSG